MLPWYIEPVNPDPVLQDERLTTAGLFFEAWAGLNSTLERRLRQECGLSVQWFELLLRLARSPGQRLRMCDLAAQVSMSPSGLTRAVDRLEAEGLVVREHCPDDRRVAWAQLTATRARPRRGGGAGAPRHLQEHFFSPLDDRRRRRSSPTCCARSATTSNPTAAQVSETRRRDPSA